MAFLKVSDLVTAGPHDAVLVAANYVSPMQLARMRAVVVPPGTVLMPKIGAAMRGRRRRVRTGVPAAFDNNVLALVPVHVESSYLTYWLSQLPIEPLTQPGAVASLDMAAFRALSLPEIPLVQQREVSEFLDRECARIDELDGEASGFVRATECAAISVVSELLGTVLCPRRPLHTMVDPYRRIMYGIVLPGESVDNGVLLVKGGWRDPGGSVRCL